VSAFEHTVIGAISMAMQQPAEPDPSKTKWAVWIPIIVAVSGAVGSGLTWGINQFTEARKEQLATKNAEKAKNERLLKEYLIPIETKLDYNQSVYKQLSSIEAIPGYGVLRSYVIRAREGTDKALQAISFPLITDLVKNDAEISLLLERYETDALTDSFKQESKNFLEHAHTFIISVQALPKMIEAGADLPTLIPFPQGFPGALEGEIAKRRGLATAARSR
jgi:hypothetical protein